MKKSILIAAAITVAIIALVWWRQTQNQTNATAIHTGTTRVNSTEKMPPYDFGSVSMLKGNVEHEFVITNTFSQELALIGIETSCMCTRAVLRLSNGQTFGPFGMAGHGFNPSVYARVAPGEAFTVKVVFDSAAHGPAGIGLIERLVSVATNQGAIALPFRARVTP